MRDHACLDESAFPDDDGLIDPRLADCADGLDLLANLPVARVFVPLVQVDGDMATVRMTGVDGRSALLVFTSVEAVAQWNSAARPVPVHGRDAAQVAVTDGASAMLVDVDQPSFTVIETEDLHYVANGYTLVRAGDGAAWVRA